jgi:hypothetical protein
MQAGQVIRTSQTVNEDYVGIDPDRGVIIFQVELDFERPGGYDFVINATASEPVQPGRRYELYSGRYRWMEIDTLSGWKLFVDVQEPPKPEPVATPP